MSFHLQRTRWMPSPPLAPDDGPIDLEHLEHMTLGDAALKRELLELFVVQAAGLIGRLASRPPDAGALAHTLKGSARAIGAFRVADCAETVEATIRAGGNSTAALAALETALAEAREAVAAILRLS
jgi:HPt (histidine-containing phosphotransfer) domain-containing protein